MPRVFSYGALQRSDVQQSMYGRAVPGVPDRLPRYTVGRSGANANAVLTGVPDECVQGVVLELTAEELRTTDAFPADGMLSFTDASGWTGTVPLSSLVAERVSMRPGRGLLARFIDQV